MLARTSGATVVDVGGREVMAVGTWLSGLPVAVEGCATTDDFTTEENVSADVALLAPPVAGIAEAVLDVNFVEVGAAVAVVAAASVDDPRATVDEGKKSNVGMVLLSPADAVEEELAMLVAVGAI